jgi:hypothetical protein
MERMLDNYIGTFENKRGLNQQETAPREYIYNAAENISKIIDDVDKGIEDAKSKIFSESGGINEEEMYNKVSFNDNLSPGKEEFSFSVY